MRILAVIFAALVVVVTAFEEESPSIYGKQRLSDQVNNFKDEFNLNDIGLEDFDEDVSQTSINRQKRGIYYKGDDNTVNFKSYPRYHEIHSYIKYITNRYPFAKYIELGRSFEDRQIMGVKFSSGPGRKPIVFIDAGFHAREWIAPTTALYAIKQLAENPRNHYLFKNVDIYIVPLVNPDGYEYTHSNSSTRGWRKTRSSVHGSSKCRGTDLNRNFELKWMAERASQNPCNSNFAGSRPFSEPESRAIRDFILARRDLIKVYLTLHSFGQYFLHPWGFTEELPKNEPVLRCVANAALDKLTKIRGTKYTVGSSTNVLYKASGGSDDWAMGVAGIPIVFTIELPPIMTKFPRITDFQPPVSEIEPVGRETFEAFKVFFSYPNGKICPAS